VGEAHQAAPRCILNVSSTSGVHGNAGQANYRCVLESLGWWGHNG
jgi:hypothetical protein